MSHSRKCIFSACISHSDGLYICGAILSLSLAVVRRECACKHTHKLRREMRLFPWLDNNAKTQFLSFSSRVSACREISSRRCLSIYTIYLYTYQQLTLLNLATFSQLHRTSDIKATKPTMQQLYLLTRLFPYGCW